MKKLSQPHWLNWVKELQFIAQAGLTYTRDDFDKERFERIRHIAAEMMSAAADLPLEKVKNLFYTGQFTVPGPGVPPSLISGEVVAKQVLKHFKY